MQTTSICPICKKSLTAKYIYDSGMVYLSKTCPDHGDFRAAVWNGSERSFKAWQEEMTVDIKEEELCDLNCHGCTKHLTPPCCVVLEITKRCNLHCPFCLAAAGEESDETLPFETVRDQLDDMYEMGVRSVHFGGGEPTVRDDFLEIASYARDKSFEYIQLNTNGIRIAKEEGYALKLADAGIDCVFLQFDGTDDEIYKKIRGTSLFGIKRDAIDACDKAYLGVILVPTLIPGVNDNDLGNILRFAYDRIPAVRGIHFQPVTYMGRTPVDLTSGREAEDTWTHITIPEVLRGLEVQSDGLVSRTDIYPSTADHSLCGFHGEFRKTKEGLFPLAHRKTSCCCCCAPANEDSAVNAAGESIDLPAAVRREQLHVQERWTRAKETAAEGDSLDAALKDLRDSSFTISGMSFQDAMTLDTKRMMQCTLRKYHEGTLIPFCLFHTTHAS